MKRIYLIITIILLLGTQDIKPVFSADEPFYAAPKVRPNVLIILDRSGSMAGDVGGGTASLSCPTPAYPSPLVVNGDYSRICIARQVLFDLLDANNNNIIDDTNDPTTLDVRLGYSRFINVPNAVATGASEGGGYIGGNIRVINDVNTSYITLWSNINTLTTGGYTPLGTALQEALQYFTNAPAVTSDGCKSCRKNNVILVTDGADTVTCTAGSESVANRRATVWAAQTLRKGPDGIAGTDDDINVFVVGFGGDLPLNLQYTLNWAAYYGYGGNDPNPAGNTDTGSFTPGAQLCDSASADPGAEIKLGYAFLSNDASSLASALQNIIGAIKQGSYSRSAPVLTASGSRIYAGFFDLGTNINWRGHLKAWKVDNDPLSPTYGQILLGTVPDPCTSTGSDYFGEIYDAGVALTNSGCIAGYVAPDARKIWTVVNTVPNSLLTEFQISSTTSTPADQVSLCTDLIKTSPATCTSAEATSTAPGSANELINFIRFASPTFNGNGGARDNTWRLGDIWHSTPVIVGPPKGTFNSTAYKDFKSYYSSRKQILIVGADDGMLHALDDEGNSPKAKELWSFIPNNLLGKLQNLSTGHAFFVDSSPSAADVCLNTNNCGKPSLETRNDWKTVVISGERDGGSGYFALDITDTTSPLFKWQFTDVCLGNTWSKPTIGKVRYFNGSNTVDKWVTFFGGGAFSQPSPPPNPDTRVDCNIGGNDAILNKGNYVYAVDILDGSLLGSGSNQTKKLVDSANTSNNVPSALRPVDFNGDYYVDTVYFGDASGKMYRWDVSNLANDNSGALTKFFVPDTTHYYINNIGNRVVEGSTHTNRPIYYMPAVTLNKDFRPVVIFGTGYIDELAATAPDTTTTDYVYAIRQEIGYTGTETDQGGVTELWKITLDCGITNSVCGERLAAAPIIFGGYAYFTTYRPPTAATCTENGNTVSCDPGSGWLYIVDLETGAALSGYPVSLGEGVPNFIIANDKVYGVTSNPGEQKITTTDTQSKSTGADVIYWRER